MRSDLIKRFVVGKNSAVPATTWTNIQINIPVDVTTGMGVQIWGVEYEIGPTGGAGLAHTTFFDTADNVLEIILSRSQVTAIKFVSDADVIDKYKLQVQVGAAGTFPAEMVIHRDFYPAIPYFSNQVNIGIYCSTTCSIDVKVWYSVVMLSRDEMMGILTNQGFR